MFYSFLADLLIVIHLVFIGFVLFGALLVLYWPRLVWIHIPVCFWGMTVEFTGWICPLTPLEIELRLKAGDQGFSGSFVAEYLIPVLYPEGLTLSIQWMLGGFVILINLIFYSNIIRKKLFL